jgi:hypothetical protein
MKVSRYPTDLLEGGDSRLKEDVHKRGFLLERLFLLCFVAVAYFEGFFAALFRSLCYAQIQICTHSWSTTRCAPVLDSSFTTFILRFMILIDSFPLERLKDGLGFLQLFRQRL